MKYEIICDETNNPPEVIERNQLVVDIRIHADRQDEDDT